MTQTAPKHLKIMRGRDAALEVISLKRYFYRVFTPDETRELCEALPELFPEHFPSEELGTR